MKKYPFALLAALMALCPFAAGARDVMDILTQAHPEAAFHVTSTQLLDVNDYLLADMTPTVNNRLYSRVMLDIVAPDHVRLAIDGTTTDIYALTSPGDTLLLAIERLDPGHNDVRLRLFDTALQPVKTGLPCVAPKDFGLKAKKWAVGVPDLDATFDNAAGTLTVTVFPREPVTMSADENAHLGLDADTVLEPLTAVYHWDGKSFKPLVKR